MKFTQGTGPNKCHLNILADPATEYSFDNSGNISKKVQQSYYDHVKVNNAATTAVKKFDDPNTIQQGSSSNDYRDIVVFHLSDIYLLAAEAYLMLNQPDKSLYYSNSVRARAKATAIDSVHSYEPYYMLS